MIKSSKIALVVALACSLCAGFEKYGIVLDDIIVNRIVDTSKTKDNGDSINAFCMLYWNECQDGHCIYCQGTTEQYCAYQCKIHDGELTFVFKTGDSPENNSPPPIPACDKCSECPCKKCHDHNHPDNPAKYPPVLPDEPERPWNPNGEGDDQEHPCSGCGSPDGVCTCVHCPVCGLCGGCEPGILWGHWVCQTHNTCGWDGTYCEECAKEDQGTSDSSDSPEPAPNTQNECYIHGVFFGSICPGCY